ncbi:LPS translocon maturation chaperone LptM [Parvularcula lutaonensis]
MQKRLLALAVLAAALAACGKRAPLEVPPPPQERADARSA